MSESDKLSYSELVDILCLISVRLDIIEKCFVILRDMLLQQDEWLTLEMLRGRLKIEQYSRKTPYRRLSDIEDSLQGFIQFYHADQERLQAKKKPRSKWE